MTLIVLMLEMFECCGKCLIILLLPSLDVVQVPPEPRPAGGRAGGHGGAGGS